MIQNVTKLLISPFDLIFSLSTFNSSFTKFNVVQKAPVGFDKKSFLTHVLVVWFLWICLDNWSNDWCCD